MASYSRSSFGSWSVDAVGVLFPTILRFSQLHRKRKKKKEPLKFPYYRTGASLHCQRRDQLSQQFLAPFLFSPKTDVPGLTHQQSGQRAAHHQFPNSLSLSFPKMGSSCKHRRQKTKEKMQQFPFSLPTDSRIPFSRKRRRRRGRFYPPDTIYFFCSDTFLTTALALAIVPFPIFTLLSHSPSPPVSFLRKVATPTERMFRLHDTLTPFSLFPFFPCGGWGAVSPPPPLGVHDKRRGGGMCVALIGSGRAII